MYPNLLCWPKQNLCPTKIKKFQAEINLYLYNIYGICVFKFQNGLISGLPNVMRFVGSLVFSWIIDSMIATKRCSITFARKLATAIGKNPYLKWRPKFSFKKFVYWGSAGLFSPIQRHIHIQYIHFKHSITINLSNIFPISRSFACCLFLDDGKRGVQRDGRSGDPHPRLALWRLRILRADRQQCRFGAKLFRWKNYHF